MRDPLNPTIFREYDIRGIVDRDLTADTVGRIARAMGTRWLRAGRATAAIGRDVRTSSTTFAHAVATGLADVGIDVLDVGVVTTPMLYWSIIARDRAAGVMITGSHNPVDYNGLKICDGPGAISGAAIQDIRRLAEAGDFESGAGAVVLEDVTEDYRRDVLGRFRFHDKFRVVIDCGNGVAGPFVPGVLRDAGHEVTELYCEPDGTFPNHLPDPEVPEYMRELMERVRSEKADVGFGFDGDADRVGLIDENGRKISADWLLAVFARDMLKRHPGGKVRYDVKCTDFLDRDVREHGGEPVMGRTGHSILKADMAEMDAVLGGELSGHIVFGRGYHLIDDSFYCALKVLDILQHHDGPCSSLFDGFPESFSTAEIKAAVPEDRKFALQDEIVAEFAKDFDVVTVDGVRFRTDDGWGLVRASNTTANLTIRLEAWTEEGFDRLKALLLERLGKHDAIDLEKVRAAEVE